METVNKNCDNKINFKNKIIEKVDESENDSIFESNINLKYDNQDIYKSELEEHFVVREEETKKDANFENVNKNCDNEINF